uniref:Uncharacterized protein n=1 Tax=Oryza punctata TaxID=4537 RepID=A0A0E0MKI1_ORYPU
MRLWSEAAWSPPHPLLRRSLADLRPPPPPGPSKCRPRVWLLDRLDRTGEVLGCELIIGPNPGRDAAAGTSCPAVASCPWAAAPGRDAAAPGVGIVFDLLHLKFPNSRLFRAGLPLAGFNILRSTSSVSTGESPWRPPPVALSGDARLGSCAALHPRLLPTPSECILSKQRRYLWP